MNSKTSLKMCLLTVLILLISMVGSANADYIFGTPTNLGPTVNSVSNDQGPSISADGLSLYFSDHENAPYRPGGYGRSDIWVTTRQTKDEPEPVDQVITTYGSQPGRRKTAPGVRR